MKNNNMGQIGIMSVAHEGRPPFGKQTYFFEDMVKYCGLNPERLFFFSPVEWNLEDELVCGYTFLNGKWKEIKREIPVILYDRAFSSDNDQKLHLEECRKVLLSSGHHFMNSLELTALLNNKHVFHDFLGRNGIPTILANPFKVMEDRHFLNSLNLQKIYIKPIFGSKGEGIYVIKKDSDGYLLFDDKGNVTPVRDYTLLIDILKGRIKTEDYFVQPAAEIEQIHDAPFDIRVLVQNYGDRYEVTGKAVRIGKKNSMTSNLNAGGGAIPISELKDFFIQNYDTTITDLESQIDKLCLECSEVLRNEYGEFCEIGFDVLITKDKGPIILEGNAKPSRWVFVKMADYLESQGKDNAYYLGRRKETVSVPMIYANYLSTYSE